MPERREQPRAVLGSTATVTTGGVELECRIMNLSAGGMAIETDASRNLARFVHVRTDLGPGTTRIDLDAMVVRRELRGESIVWGLTFRELPERLESLIERYVRGTAAAG